jgi:uncharacterized protein
MNAGGFEIVESTLAFDCEGERLCGIVSAPRGHAPELGLVVVVGGPQYRAGSHRQFVLLARAAAQAGHAVLRFDVRGMGDSSGALRRFEEQSADIGAALQAFGAAVPSVRRVVLWGLCDGASAALLYLHDTRDRRIHGLCLVNPWVRSEQSLARTHVRHYYLKRLAEADFWRKLLRGGVGATALKGLAGNLRKSLQRSAPGGGDAAGRDAPFQQLMARACAGFGGPLLLVLSGNDLTAREFADLAEADAHWRHALQRPNITRQPLPDADHTMSAPADRRRHEQDLLRWLSTGVAA